MIRLCSLAFNLLSPQRPVERRKLFWRLGFSGAGILDCVEMISHAVREGRCMQQPEHQHPEAPLSLNGQFVFEISYNGRTLQIWTDICAFGDEFRSQVSNWQDRLVNSERKAYLDYKAGKAAQIMALPGGELLHYRWK